MKKMLRHCLMVSCMVIASLNCSSDKTLSWKDIVFAGATGGMAGFGEVVFPGQIMRYAMNQKITGERFVRADCYKGFSAHAIGQIPIPALQKMVEVKGLQALESLNNRKLSDTEKIGVSFSAGAIGALVDTPSNAIQLYQQREGNAGKSALQALQDVGIRKSFRGLAPNAFIKEGTFTVGYQIAGPKGKEFAQQYIHNETVASVVGGSSAGVLIAVISQPGAVLTNRLQGDLSGQIYRTTLQTAQKICKEEGAQGLLKGISRRGPRVAIAIQLYGEYIKIAEELMK